MNTWKVRYQGTQLVTEGLTGEAVIEGIKEEQWDPTDEVMGPGDRDWQSLEKHPYFAQAIADMDPPSSPPHPDEARLDMNPLIDVALVLLIFFILTTTYTEMRREFLAPSSSKEDVKPVSEGKLKEFTIRVNIGMSENGAFFKVENQIVAEKDLQQVLEGWIAKTGNPTLAVEVDRKVPYKAFADLLNAAAGAKIREIVRIERPRSE